MCIKGWKYYNHAMIPEAPPSQSVDNSPIKSGQIWQKSAGGHHYSHGGQVTGTAAMKQIGGIS